MSAARGLALGLCLTVGSCGREPATDPEACPPEQPSVDATAPARAPHEAAAFQARERDGVRGGELVLEVEAEVGELVEALLDFEHAAGHRAWGTAYRELEREPQAAPTRVLAEWQLRGRMGIAPKIELEFLRTGDVRAALVSYRLTKPAMGVASFFGEHRVERISTDPPRVRWTASVYIDSGLTFVNASTEDFENGLREDARLVIVWLGQRR